MLHLLEPESFVSVPLPSCPARSLSVRGFALRCLTCSLPFCNGGRFVSAGHTSPTHTYPTTQTCAPGPSIPSCAPLTARQGGSHEICPGSKKMLFEAI